MLFLTHRATEGPGLARAPQPAGGEAGVTPPHALALGFLGQGLGTSLLGASVFYFCRWTPREATPAGPGSQRAG